MVPLCPWIFQVRESLLWVVSPAILPNRESIPKGPHLFPFTSSFSGCFPFPYRAWHSSAILPVCHLSPTPLPRSNLSLSWSSHPPSTILQSRNALWTLAFPAVSPSQSIAVYQDSGCPHPWVDTLRSLKYGHKAAMYVTLSFCLLLPLFSSLSTQTDAACSVSKKLQLCKQSEPCGSLLRWSTWSPMGSLCLPIKWAQRGPKPQKEHHSLQWLRIS